MESGEQGQEIAGESESEETMNRQEQNDLNERLKAIEQQLAEMRVLIAYTRVVAEPEKRGPGRPPKQQPEAH